MRGIGRIKNVAKHIRSYIEPSVIILLYHRVIDLHSDPQLLCVSLKNFAEQLEMIVSKYNPISLQELCAAVRNKKIPKRGVVITFDDGYADNLYNAKPLLEEYSIPATIFVTTGNFAGNGQEFWWDELERILLQPGLLPEELDLKIGNNSYHWELDGFTLYKEDDFFKYNKWGITDKTNPTLRQSLYRSLCHIIQPLAENEKKIVLNDLRIWAEKDSKGRETHATLSLDEIKKLDEEGLIEIGSHAVSHSLLSSLDQEEQNKEIKQSKVYLEKILGHQIYSFSYPYGSRSSYTHATIDAIKEADFKCACSNYSGSVWSDSDLFQLPRILVRNWTRSEFKKRLKRWFHS